MIQGIILAIVAGIMLGLYALPEKFTKGFAFENTWGAYFVIALFITPIISCFALINGFGDLLASLPSDVIFKMAIASLLWGAGVTMWGKAINYIGVSLGFSIFIGTVILVGSLLPFAVDGLPASNMLTTILIGLFVVLLGIIANGRAGIIRHKQEASEVESSSSSSMMTGIIIAIVGGLLATGFSYANAVGAPSIMAGVLDQGNPEWMTSIAIMFIIYVSAGFLVVPYFIYQLSTKKLWSNFKSEHLALNLSMSTIMGVFNFAASALFAYAAYSLGSEAGNTVGYAIYNTTSVALAIIGGLLTREWVGAPAAAKRSLYFGLAAMIVGVVIIAVGNSMA